MIEDRDPSLSRTAARIKIDEYLNRPFEQKAADEYDRDNWGSSPEALLEAEKKDTMWGAMTHGE